MKKIFLFSLVVLGCIACRNTNTFCIEGTLATEDNQTLYLERMDLMGAVAVDSATLSTNGTFRFRSERPEYPELYRLRAGRQSLYIAVDSLETIAVEGNLGQLAEATVSGSVKSEQIQTLRRSLRDSTLEAHKALAQKIIIADPSSMVAYYALFQMKAGAPVFNPLIKAELPYFRAVATSFNAFRPNDQRSKVLYQQVLDIIQSDRMERQNALIQAYIEEQGNALLDIRLKDVNGDERALSDKQGHYCVLSFASTLMERYTAYTFEMKEVWNAYHGKGLEIYEVYPDPARLSWEDQVRALPWTCVRTENSVNDPVYSTYNVQSLPTIFLIDKNGNVIARVSSFEHLQQLLREKL